MVATSLPLPLAQVRGGEGWGSKFVLVVLEGITQHDLIGSEVGVIMLL